MNKNIIFQSLLQTMKIAYSMNSEMVKFAPFPNDIISQDVVPHHCKCSNYLQADRRLISKNYPKLQNTIIAASEFVHWRETYKGTNIGDYFMDRFG